MHFKRLIILIGCLLTVSFLYSQDVVSWNYYSKKSAPGTYEIHLTARVQSPWHIYSGSTPDGGPIPTKINFSKNPLTHYLGDVKEVGHMEQGHEGVFGVDVKFYSGEVDFVQLVQLKNKVK